MRPTRTASSMGNYETRRVAGESALGDAFAVRRTVFVDEQGVPEDVELDGKDETATHFVVYDPETERPVATARIRFPDEDTGKAERVAVLDEYRGEGIGSRLVRRVEAHARDCGCSRMNLDAQTDVEGFYTKLGYETASDVFVDAGIPHVRMTKEL